MAEGIEIRIGKDGVRSYRASVWSNRDGKRIRKTFPTMAAAKSWRQDAAGAVRRGRCAPPRRSPSPRRPTTGSTAHELA